MSTIIAPILVFELPPLKLCRGEKDKSPIVCVGRVELVLISPKLVLNVMEKVRSIRERLKVAQSRQRWSDNRRRDLKGDVDDLAYLKV